MAESGQSDDQEPAPNPFESGRNALRAARFTQVMAIGAGLAFGVVPAVWAAGHLVAAAAAGTLILRAVAVLGLIAAGGTSIAVLAARNVIGAGRSKREIREHLRALRALQREHPTGAGLQRAASTPHVAVDRATGAPAVAAAREPAEVRAARSLLAERSNTGGKIEGGRKTQRRFAAMIEKSTSPSVVAARDSLRNGSASIDLAKLAEILVAKHEAGIYEASPPAAPSSTRAGDHTLIG